MAVCAPTCGCAIQTETLALSGSGSAADPWVINQANDPAIADLQAQIDTINAALDDDYIPYADFNAKGDLLVGTADDNGSRLAPGPFGRVLTTDSAAASGVKWGGGVVEIETLPGTGGAVSFTNIPQDFTHLKVVGWLAHNDASGANGFRPIHVRFNAILTAYYSMRQEFLSDGNAPGALVTVNNANSMQIGQSGDYAGSFELFIPNYSGNGPKVCQGFGWAARETAPGTLPGWMLWNGAGRSSLVAGAVTGVSLAVGGGEAWADGDVTLLGIA